MALFKIEQGLAENLVKNRSTAHNGWCYFTVDDGKFYIDIADSSSVVLAKSNNDTSANRIPINAFYADRVSFAPQIKYKHNDTGELDLQIVMGKKYDSATGTVVENSSGYLEFPVADSENYGIVSTKEQSFSGAKTFLASPVFTQGIKLKGVGTNGADSFILSQQKETTTNAGALYLFTSGNNNLYHNSSDNKILTQNNYKSIVNANGKANQLVWNSSDSTFGSTGSIWTNGSALVIGTTTAPTSYSDYALRVEGKTKLGSSVNFGDTYSLTNGVFSGEYSFSDDLTLNSALTVKGTTTACDIVSAKTNTYSLGSSSNLWANVYATNLHGNGANIGSLNASKITSGTLSENRLPSKDAWATTYGDTTAQKPAFGATFDIPYITTDKYGRVTGGNTVTVTIPNSTASTTANGLMTKAMVTKLNGIATGAEVNQNAYGKISDGTNTTTAAQEQDTITFKGSHLRATVLNNEVTYELTQGNIQDLIGETMTKTEIDAAIDAAINGLIDGAPGTLNTLNEIAAALKDNPDTVTTIIEDLGKKVNKAGDTMTGTLTLTNSTSALSATGPASFKSTVTFDGTTSFSDTITTAGNIVPNVNNSVNLGSSSYKWATVYATKFNGKATSADAADVATKVSNALTINGLTYDGSAAKNVGTIGVAYGGTGKTEWTANRIIYSSGKTTLANATNMYISNTQLGVNVTTAPSTGIALQVGGNIAANADNTYTLGTDGYKWATVYATTFSGNATSANKVNHKFTVNGIDFDGSSDQDAGVIATTHGGTGNDAYTADQLIYSSTAAKLSGAANLWSNGSALAVGATSSTYLAALEAYTFSVAGASQFDGATYISSTGTLIVQNTATSTGSTASSFAVQIDGGVCIEQNLRVKKAAYFSSSITASSSISASGLYLSSSYAYLYYSDTTNGVNSQLNFRVYRKIPTASGASTYKKSSRYETYYLDATNDSYGTTSTGNVGSYKILSTKSTVTVGQGGTGKTSWTANRLIYSSATTTLANTTNIYVNASQMNIGSATAPSSDITLKVSGNTSVGGYVAPDTDNTYTSGTADYKWSTVYATTFSGNATSANKVNNTFTVNGVSFDGSAKKDAGIISVTYGGTGVNTQTANRLVYATTSGTNTVITSTGHYATSTTLGVNMTTAPSSGMVFQVDGNSLFGGTVSVNGITSIDNTTNSTSATTGALVVSGGLGVKLATNIGSTLTVAGATTLNSTLSVGNTTTACSINSAKDSTYNLGTNTNRWANVFADTFHGTFGHDGTITKSLKLTTSWMDTGIIGNTIMTNAAGNSAAALTTGSYVIQVYCNATTEGYDQEYYTGVMSWYAGTCNDTSEPYYDEIVLHGNGYAKTKNLYLRTARQASSAYMKLQICSDVAWSAAGNIQFTFKRII